MDVTSKRRQGAFQVPPSRVINMNTKVYGCTNKEWLSPVEQLTVQQALKKLETLDSEFKQYHLAVTDTLEDEGKLEQKQAIPDNHNDRVIHLEQFNCLPWRQNTTCDPWLTDLKWSMWSVNITIKPMASGPDVARCLLE